MSILTTRGWPVMAVSTRIRCQCSETGPCNVEISKKQKSAGRAYADILRGCAFRFFIDRPVAGQGREPRNIVGQCLVAANHQQATGL